MKIIKEHVVIFIWILYYVLSIAFNNYFGEQKILFLIIGIIMLLSALSIRVIQYVNNNSIKRERKKWIMIEYIFLPISFAAIFYFDLIYLVPFYVNFPISIAIALTIVPTIIVDMVYKETRLKAEKK